MTLGHAARNSNTCDIISNGISDSRTYRQQKGLTLQAGWEDKLDLGLDLYRDTFEASLKILTPILSPRVLTPIDLDALEVMDTELDLPTDVCKLTHIEH